MTRSARARALEPLSDEEEDDYLTMALPPSPKQKAISSLAQAAAKRRAGEQAGFQPSKRMREADAKKRFEEGIGRDLLSSDLSSKDRDEQAMAGKSNDRGRKLMAAMGYKGGPLGPSSGSKEGERRPSPIRVTWKNDKAGIGAPPPVSKKQKRSEATGSVRQSASDTDKPANAEDFRQRMAANTTLRLDERRLTAALYLAAEFWDRDHAVTDEVPIVIRAQKALVDAKDKAKAERDARATRMDRILDDDSDDGGLADDDADRVARGEDLSSFVPLLGDKEDNEDKGLEEFQALSVAERLKTVVHFLRIENRYCWWCRAQYDDDKMEGCPGEEEEGHA
ncbi:hypothetical protein ANO11243_006410 [Dothideomycetidae sp. 11243]|nr:hypothetical protein ANO11243_006410 [fungal sp. No.11243]